MRYILNSAVITTPGIYEYRHISMEEAKRWLSKPGWTSTIGYEETAVAMEVLLGVKPEVNRQQIKMKAGNEALVFRLTRRLSQPEMKGKQGLQMILENHEIGILRKMADIV